MSNKVIIIESKSTPSEWGYNDKVAVFDYYDLVFHSEASCCPNPCKPWPNSTIEWRNAYGWLNVGTYSWRCLKHWRYGKCLLINEGKTCTARRPNINHNGLSIISQLFIHKGWTAKWRGSAGCPTIPPAKWGKFMSKFDINEVGKLSIIDFSEMEIGQRCRLSKHCPIFEDSKPVLPV